MAGIDRSAVKDLEARPAPSAPDVPPMAYRFARVPTSSGQARWTVVDSTSAILDSADDYLESLRVELEVDELTTKQYSRNLACFLTWAAENGLDLESAAGELRAFPAYLQSTDAPADVSPLARPQRIGQVLATVRGFYLHLVRSKALSPQVLAHLQEVVELVGVGVTSYAQNGEDLQIAHYVGGRERVTYIDVGCLWPRHFSNSYFFYERGGHGLCIDANPTVAEGYMRVRPRDLFLNCGVAAERGTMTYYMHESPVFNTFSAEHAAELAKRLAATGDPPQREGRTLIGTVEVPTMTLDEAVQSTGFAARCGGRVDFLSVDVEGLELQVLSGFSFQELRPRVVVIEDFRRGAEARMPPEELELTHTMKAHRYWLAGRAGVNLYFTDEDA